jgi:hypothetical protein
MASTQLNYHEHMPFVYLLHGKVQLAGTISYNCSIDAPVKCVNGVVHEFGFCESVDNSSVHLKSFLCLRKAQQELHSKKSRTNGLRLPNAKPDSASRIAERNRTKSDQESCRKERRLLGGDQDR